MLSSELGNDTFCTATALFFGGAASGSSPLASRFFRLSRLFRFDLAPSACTDVMLGGIGDDRTLASDKGPLRIEGFVGGRMGELILDEGADEPAGCVAVMVKIAVGCHRC